jgi:ATP-dependent Clp protease ATP-binding subunit ClpB
LLVEHSLADPTVGDASTRDAVMAVVRQAFKPEFLNRLDEVVLFDQLGTDELTRIVDLQVEALAARLVSRRITLEVSPAAREWLALTGFDPTYGARPLRRLVQTAIGDQLARGLLSGDVTDGSRVRVDEDTDSDTLRVSPEG